MASEGMDYAAFLADLEAKKVAIDNAINAVRQLLNLGAQEGVGAPTPAGGKKDQPAEVRFDSFFGMSTPEAVRKYLAMMKRPQLASDIAKALLEGGLPTTSNNIGNVVGPTLSRMKAAGDLIPIKGRWALAEWYPAGARERLEAVEKGKSKKHRKAGRPKGKSKAQTKSDASPSPTEKPASSKPTPEQVEQIMKLHAGGKKPGEIAKAVGLHHFSVAHVIKSKQAA
jgi:hypothetical protein